MLPVLRDAAARIAARAPGDSVRARAGPERSTRDPVGSTLPARPPVRSSRPTPTRSCAPPTCCSSTSGTATLEAALLGTPMVVCYRLLAPHRGVGRACSCACRGSASPTSRSAAPSSPRSTSGRSRPSASPPRPLRCWARRAAPASAARGVRRARAACCGEPGVARAARPGPTQAGAAARWRNRWRPVDAARWRRRSPPGRARAGRDAAAHRSRVSRRWRRAGRPRRPLIYAVWHGRILMVPVAQRAAARARAARARCACSPAARATASWSRAGSGASASRWCAARRRAAAPRRCARWPRAVRAGETWRVVPDGPRGPTRAPAARRRGAGRAAPARRSCRSASPRGRRGGCTRGTASWSRCRSPAPRWCSAPLAHGAARRRIARRRAPSSSARCAKSRPRPIGWWARDVRASTRLALGRGWSPVYAPVAARAPDRARRSAHLRERLGLRARRAATGRACGWIHAVSVGEAIAAAPLVEGLRRRWPSLPLVVSTVTETGARVVRERFARAGQPSLLPARLPRRGAPRRSRRSIRRSSSAWRPSCGPTSCARWRAGGVPAMIANGRLSDRSFSRYRLVRGAMRRVLGNVTVLRDAVGRGRAPR